MVASSFYITNKTKQYCSHRTRKNALALFIFEDGALFKFEDLSGKKFPTATFLLINFMCPHCDFETFCFLKFVFLTDRSQF